jgi:hypothetical protein
MAIRWIKQAFRDVDIRVRKSGQTREERPRPSIARNAILEIGGLFKFSSFRGRVMTPTLEVRERIGRITIPATAINNVDFRRDRVVITTLDDSMIIGELITKEIEFELYDGIVIHSKVLPTKEISRIKAEA